MKMNCVLILAALGACSSLLAQEVEPGRSLLGRRYREGETLVYRMTGTNDGRRYEAQARGVVRKDPSGIWIEEYAWSNLTLNGAPVSLRPGIADFSQALTLDPRKAPGIPNLAGVNPILIGPITDLLTFYADLWLAERLGNLSKAGDHVYHEHGTPASWADGSRVVLGEDSIDFDITLTQIDPARKIAILLVRHVPPRKPQLRLPSAWMREPVADTPNNWVQVVRNSGKYVAAVGKETFDIQLTVSLSDGKILSGTLENPVKAEERDCEDAALTNCGDPRPRHIFRKIEISLIN